MWNTLTTVTELGIIVILMKLTLTLAMLGDRLIAREQRPTNESVIVALNVAEFLKD